MNSTIKNIGLALALLPLAGTLACQPGPRTICRQLADIGAVGAAQADQDALVALITDEDACVARISELKVELEDDWDDLSLCYTRSSAITHAITCERVANTLLASDLCAGILSITADQPSDDAQGTTDDVQLLAECVDTERARLSEDRTSGRSYRACVRAAATLEALEACRITHAEYVEQTTSQHDEQLPEE